MRRSKKMILLYALIACMMIFPIKAEARAGGGGHVGGGGGGSHAGGYGTVHKYRNHEIPEEIIVWGAITGVLLLVLAGSAVVFCYNAQKASKKTKQNMQSFQKLGDNWDEKEMQKRVEEAYFEIQECWKREDEMYAKEYLSKRLLKDFHERIEQIKRRNEEVYQTNVKLLSAMPVYAEDHDGTKQDKVWYLIHGKMMAYYVDKRTKAHVSGETKDEKFYEYWCFVYENGKWVLDKIKQKDEMDIKQFT